MHEIFHTGLEPSCAFVCSYPLDGILRASGERCRPINGILSDRTSAFTDQPQLCCRKHRSLQHHPCFRAMVNLQPRIRRPRCSSARATCTPVAPTADSKRNALLCALLNLPRTSSLAVPQEPSPSCSILIFGRLSFAGHPRAFFSPGDFSTDIFWTTSTRFDLRETFVTTFTFSPAVYFC